MRFFIEDPNGEPLRSVEGLFKEFPKLKNLNIIEEIKTEETSSDVLPTFFKGGFELGMKEAKRVIINAETPLKLMQFVDILKMNVSLRYRRVRGCIRPNYRVIRLTTPFE